MLIGVDGCGLALVNKLNAREWMRGRRRRGYRTRIEIQ